MVSPSVLHSALLAPFHLREKEWDVRSLVEKVSKKNKKLVGLLLLEENHSHFVLAANLTSSSAMRSFIPTSWNPLSSNLFRYILTQKSCHFFLVFINNKITLIWSAQLCHVAPRQVWSLYKSAPCPPSPVVSSTVCYLFYSMYWVPRRPDFVLEPQWIETIH